ncbi:AfsR/SARP family transcriptional regulator [Streptomyces sp. P38-E01]|uniref:AfsR/SARP family transcriptional regulator n=1 Tax=Streptomyces tardus TaxID=2780544 RepID=A0A949N7S5_9ACTN|nr:BTAD domain-containing putative transcriptional regulator [Streptomyces tardus]MBU7600427.1 AfsR/SARP family transcriptional regulator [Streptomyces tardus]
MLEVRILGGIEALRSGSVLALGPDQRRAVLGVLALEANRPVSLQKITRMLWGGDSPEGAKGSIQAHISRLRSVLFAGGEHREAIETVPGGYRLVLESGRVDIVRFDELVARARRAGDSEARALYSEALRLWRGRPMATARYLESLSCALQEKCLLVYEDSVETRLRLGEAAQLVPELTAMAHEHLHRPRLTGALMKALQSSGRTAEALHHYDLVRRNLVEQAGLEPGVELRRLQAAVLREEDSRQKAHL